MAFELLMFLLFKIWGFLDLLEPRDQVIADRSLKIKTNLVMKQCKLSIPPSPAKGNLMTSSDAKKT